MKRAIALVTESTRRDGTRQGFAAPRPVGAPLTEPAPPPKKDRLRGRCPSESSPGSRAPNPDSSHSNWTILWGQVKAPASTCLTARNLNSAENFLLDNVMAPLSTHCKKMLNELSHFRGPLQSAAHSSFPPQPTVPVLTPHIDDAL